LTSRVGTAEEGKKSKEERKERRGGPIISLVSEQTEFDQGKGYTNKGRGEFQSLEKKDRNASLKPAGWEGKKHQIRKKNSQRFRNLNQWNHGVKFSNVKTPKKGGG